jgi:hypothetical protein
VGGLGVVVVVVAAGIWWWGQDEPLRLVEPTDIAVADDGTVYIADPGLHRVFAASDGELRVVAGNGEDGADSDDGLVGPEEEAAGEDLPTADEVALDGPTSIAVAGDTLYVGDRGQILEVTDGRVRVLADSSRLVGHLAAAPDGDLYYYELGSDQGVMRIASAGDRAPRGLVDHLDVDGLTITGLHVGADETAYVLSYADGVLAIGPDGRTRTTVEAEPGFVDLGGSHVDEILELTVADRGEDQITVLTTEGDVERRVWLGWVPQAVAVGSEDTAITVLRWDDPTGQWVYRIDGLFLDSIEPLLG